MVVLITGANRGLGKALALHYLAEGATVIAVARRRSSLRELCLQADSSVRRRLHTYCCDVTDRIRMYNTVHQAWHRQGPIDLIIANAGTADRRLEPVLDAGLVAEVFSVNTLGVINTLAPAVDLMVKRGSGHLVAISSLASVVSIPQLSTYCASKTALNAQLDGLYWDLKPYGVHVSTICPSFIDTDMVVPYPIRNAWRTPLDKACLRIVAAIARKPRRYCFPKFQYVLLRLIGLCPDWCKGNLCWPLFSWMILGSNSNSKRMVSDGNSIPDAASH